MGFGSVLKKAFGLSPEEDNEFDDIIASSEQNAERQPVSHHSAEAADRDADKETADTEPVSDDPELTAAIFETVVETFNQALPSFLRDSVDPKAQSRLLYSQLDKSVRDHLAMLQQRASRHSESMWQQRQTSLRAEVETYKEKLRLLEEKQNEARQAQLSAERQKRALSERVHDLESKVLKLEADAEQTDLEKKSLVNKLKVANVHDEDNEALRAEIENLRKQLSEAGSNAEAAQPEPQEKIVEKIVEVVKTVDNPNTERLLSEAITENAQLKTAASRIKNEHERELSEAYAVAKELEAKLHIANKNMKELQAELDHANEELHVAEEIQETIDKFEEVKLRQDERIASLKSENEALRKGASDSDALLQTRDALIAQLEQNIAERDRRIELLDKKLRQEQAAATPQPAAQEKTEPEAPAPAPEPAPEPEPQKETPADTAEEPAAHEPAISASILFDDVLDDTSWVSDQSADYAKPQEEFGYRPPKKRPAPPADDATRQLSLF